MHLHHIPLSVIGNPTLNTYFQQCNTIAEQTPEKVLQLMDSGVNFTIVHPTDKLVHILPTHSPVRPVQPNDKVM